MLELIVLAQNAGFSLEEIRTLLPPNLDHWDHAALVGALRRKIEDISALEARLAHSRMQLEKLIDDINAKPDDVECAANARRVLSQMLGKPVRPATT